MAVHFSPIAFNSSFESEFHLVALIKDISPPIISSSGPPVAKTNYQFIPYTKNTRRENSVPTYMCYYYYFNL